MFCARRLIVFCSFVNDNEISRVRRSSARDATESKRRHSSARHRPTPCRTRPTNVVVVSLRSGRRRRRVHPRLYQHRTLSGDLSATAHTETAIDPMFLSVEQLHPDLYMGVGARHRPAASVHVQSVFLAETAPVQMRETDARRVRRTRLHAHLGR
jgi:hypothetical protein